MKKITIFFLTIFMVAICFTKNTYALNNSSTSENGYYDEFGNYENPETGEYFRWTTNPNSRLVTVKSFEFKMRAVLTGSNVFFNEPNVKVWIHKTHFERIDGIKTTCCSKHTFTVNLRRYGVTNNVARFYAPISSMKSYDLGGGFLLSPVPYRLELTNEDELPYGVYLVGNGTIDTY